MPSFIQKSIAYLKGSRLRSLFVIKKKHLTFVIALGALFLAVPATTHALGVNDLYEALSSLFLAIGNFLGGVLITVIDILISVVQYNDFINAAAVAKGWYIVRDLCNMFFIVVLLVISFSTILRIDKYRYERLLPKLIIMAILVNFSKLIAGFFIDFGQVVMLTFVNAFRDAAAGNFTEAFGLEKMLAYRTGVTDAPGSWQYLGATILAVALLLIALVVMIAMVVIFLVRIVMLWILVVLSPLAYLLSTLPGSAASQASKWWSQFGKWVTIGPILAFFIWLSLTIMVAKPGNTISNQLGFQNAITTEQGIQSAGDTGIAATITEISKSDNLLSFAIAIAMMLMALMTAQSMGGVAGSFAGKALGSIQKGAMSMTGARWAQERWRAFQGQRESARKEKAAKFGERAYGVYGGARDFGKSMVKGGFHAVGKGIDYVGRRAQEKVRGGVTGFVAQGTVKAGARALPVGIGAAAALGAGAFLPTFGTAFLTIAGAKGIKEGSRWLKSAFKKYEDMLRAKSDQGMKGEKSNYLDSKGNDVKGPVGGGYVHHQQSGVYFKNDLLNEARFQDKVIEQVAFNEEQKKWRVGFTGTDGKAGWLDLNEGDVLTDQNKKLVDKHGLYEDAYTGFEYKYDEIRKDSYRVNKQGEAINKDGKSMDEHGSPIRLEERVYAGIGKKMSPILTELMRGYTDGRDKSWALSAKASLEKITKEYQKLTAAGLSPEMMLNGLRDRNLSKDQRIARGMALSMKDGFKDLTIKEGRLEVDRVKQLIGSNSLLEREFQENMLKRFSHLYYDISTDYGKGQLQKAATDNLVDLTKQHDSAYDTDMLRVMDKYFGKRKYVPRLEDTATNDARRKSIVSSLKEMVQGAPTGEDEEGNLDKNRTALANIDGDLAMAWATTKDELKNLADDFPDRIGRWLGNARIEHIIKTKTDLIDPTAIPKVSEKYKIDDGQAGNVIEKTIEAFGTKLTIAQVRSINSSRDASQRFKELVMDAVDSAFDKGMDKQMKISKEVWEKYKKNQGINIEDEI